MWIFAFQRLLRSDYRSIERTEYAKMEKFGKSQSVNRKEDKRFLTGQGRYIGDLVPEDALCMFVFRSPVAHAELKGLDLGIAREAGGVHLVLSFDELVAAGVHA